jgi:UrcA family protein
MARAETPAETVRHQVVRYADLNLASANGQAKFQIRLKGAVETVCGPQADLRNFDEAADYKACVAKASHDAMTTVVQREASRAR